MTANEFQEQRRRMTRLYFKKIHSIGFVDKGACEGANIVLVSKRNGEEITMTTAEVHKQFVNAMPPAIAYKADRIAQTFNEITDSAEIRGKMNAVYAALEQSLASIAADDSLNPQQRLMLAQETAREFSMALDAMASDVRATAAGPSDVAAKMHKLIVLKREGDALAESVAVTKRRTDSDAAATATLLTTTVKAAGGKHDGKTAERVALDEFNQLVQQARQRDPKLTSHQAQQAVMRTPEGKKWWNIARDLDAKRMLWEQYASENDLAAKREEFAAGIGARSASYDSIVTKLAKGFAAARPDAEKHSAVDNLQYGFAEVRKHAPAVWAAYERERAARPAA